MADDTEVPVSMLHSEKEMLKLQLIKVTDVGVS